MMEDMIIERFYKEAKSFCNYIEQTTITGEEIENLINKLLNLYLCGLKLPFKHIGELEQKESITFSVPSEADFKIEFPDSYRAVAEPLDLEEEESEMYTLSENLSIIRNILLDGIGSYEKKYYNRACYDWAMLFTVSMGPKILNAVAALHYFRTEYGLGDCVE